MSETRFVGNGPASLDSSALSDLVSWEFKPEFEMEEVQHLAEYVEKSVPVNAGWTASLKMEYAYTPRALSAIAFGSWQGINVSEWGMTAEGKIEECTGPNDPWKMFQMTQMKWQMSADKWQAVSDWQTFQRMFAAQLASGTPVSCTTPFGAGSAFLGPLSFGADGKPAKTNIELTPAAGTFTSSNVLVQKIIAAAVSVLQNGYAVPLPLALSYNPGRAFGAGSCFISKVDFKGPVGKVTCDVEVQGVGAWTFA